LAWSWREGEGRDDSSKRGADEEGNPQAEEGDEVGEVGMAEKRDSSGFSMPNRGVIRDAPQRGTAKAGPGMYPIKGRLMREVKEYKRIPKLEREVKDTRSPSRNKSSGR
jgi:hypothetical protein